MKGSRHLVSLPVIALDSGSAVGVIKSVLFNASRGKAEYLAIETPDWYRGAVILPFDAVNAIGEDAVTVSDTSVLLSVYTCPDALDMLSQPSELSDADVYTRLGRYIGRVDEYYLDEKTGMVISCTLKEGAVLGASNFLAFGKHIIIVSERTQIPDESPETAAAARQPYVPLYKDARAAYAANNGE